MVAFLWPFTEKVADPWSHANNKLIDTEQVSNMHVPVYAYAHIHSYLLFIDFTLNI